MRSVLSDMALSRRDFIKRSLILTGSLLLSPASLSGEGKRTQGWQPAYARLEKEGKLVQRIEQAYAIFDNCGLCPRKCGVNRKAGEKGFCRAPARPVIYSSNPHFGEEVSLVGHHGSGTIFFSNCNLRCVFCQNWPISHEGKGQEVKDEDLAEMMLSLQKIGCHNINLVTPTHVMPNILNATRMALKKGLRVPLVYNTSGFERLDMVRLLDGIVDIYLPDMKYMDPRMSAKYSAEAEDYPDEAKKAIIEMNRQVGLHLMDSSGIALRGLMIR
ncbi:MAG: radical SAM protein, partial [Pseudomonadota bacterium]